MHNGTIYRWNRPVYDISDGQAHLRIENRVLPAGPTVLDTMANAAFYYGLLRALVEDDDPLWRRMTFDAAEENLIIGAKFGLESRCTGRSWAGSEPTNSSCDGCFHLRIGAWNRSGSQHVPATVTSGSSRAGV